VPGIVVDLPEALGPVVAAAAEHLDRSISQMELSAIAIEFDFVNPALPARELVNRGCQRGSMNPGKGALTPIAAGFLR